MVGGMGHISKTSEKYLNSVNSRDEGPLIYISVRKVNTSKRGILRSNGGAEHPSGKVSLDDQITYVHISSALLKTPPDMKLPKNTTYCDVVKRNPLPIYIGRIPKD